MASKKTDSNRPKRPLSAYNLFYRYKRAKMIEAQNQIDSGSNNHGTNSNQRAIICQLVTMTPGLESYPPAIWGIIPRVRLDEIRRNNIRLALEQHLLAKDTKNRLHRKSDNGGFQLTFVEMNKIMGSSWKATDDFTKAVFQELADEGRKSYQQRLNEYTNNEKRLDSHGVKTMNSNPEENPKSKMPKPDITPPEAVYSAYPKTRTPDDITPMKVSSSDSSELDVSWEPLPFKNQNQERLTTSPPIPVVTMPFATDFVKRGSLDSPPLVAENFYHQPKRHVVCHSEDASYSSFFFPAVVTPAASVKQPAVGPGCFDEQRSFDGNEPTSHIVSPSAPFFSSILPLPFHVGTKGSGRDKNTHSGSSWKRKLVAHERHVSVDDFMELIATLGGGI
mmetsp:Transcript_12659/g.22724  ORF Transcript_12659/g.22724 Transcript_12659/m.22724 type:complete len:391 (-) Transcript_12659:154-1326(-)|eukprot:CAMPEP_0201885726 /NCGR_PEP_ID=MMETSP0902-20130614/19879_1 /ASSEMBLY_ACC=CAM_ASM_000551 /TAXON_ID=420261 /ORGANISM="Thalassiosira antarctica, Strain CCMP982" /LENGTH=390 /DNA_ID=CAMNT_0048415041 /DNA_START=32 /DNA_END=1204 /DNA_ORIENTATION=-